MFEFIEEILSSPVEIPDQVIGFSRQNRPVHAAVLGQGDINISLIGGCHADEPMGPRLLRKLFSFLNSRQPSHPLLKNYCWHLVPHANPDGEAVNMRWYTDEDTVFDLLPYLRFVERELPGNDVEFGFPYGYIKPGLRPVNDAIYQFWRSTGKTFHVHASLHGMMVAAGPWFLIEKEWIGRSKKIQALCTKETLDMNYILHDVDRQGEKGFHRISKGFCTRPDSHSMRKFFMERNDQHMADKFFPSSMEACRSLGGDTLTIVSEMPLFILPNLPETMNWPNKEWDQWISELEEWKQKLKETQDNDESIRKEIEESGIIAMPANDQMRLQWRFISAAIEAL